MKIYHKIKYNTGENTYTVTIEYTKDITDVSRRIKNALYTISDIKSINFKIGESFIKHLSEEDAKIVKKLKVQDINLSYSTVYEYDTEA